MLQSGQTLARLLKSARAAASTVKFQQARTVVTYVPHPGDSQDNVVTLIPGDGVGPEVTAAVVKVIDALNAPISWERFDDFIGAEGKTKVPQALLDSIRRNGVCLKGTLFTPLSKTTDTQSLNVQLRKQLDLHVNLVQGFTIPGVKTRHENLDIVVIRENTEGEYSGLEHEVVPGVVESLKVITEYKSRRTAEYAFEYAYLNNRKKVTAVHKANIMKLSDGLFLREFREVAKQYPMIKSEEMIVDNTSMQLVSHPHQFDVLVTPNLYGNLVTNVVAGLTGGAGICPGANIGEGVAIFEQGARHVARDIAGKNVANPCASLFSTSMMLRHISLPGFADRIEKAIIKVLGSGDKSVITPDLQGTGTTTSFTDAIIKAL